jgi:NAD(P)-dependent dehydrogenase (short-subunit alcohol dehydrogenase family)
MSFDFKNKVAVVTGGAMGIGEATARKLSAAGAAVAILDRNVSAARKTVSDIASNGGKCEFFECDVSRRDDVETALNSIAPRYGRIDVVVSNAGIQEYGTVVTTSEEQWDRLLDINLKGAFLVSKFALPHMLERGGAIVIVGSVQSMTAVANSVAYVVSKHALLGLTRAMAVDHAQQGIRVNCVCPGTVDTPMLRWAASLSNDPAEVIRTCDRMHPIGRIAKADEVADAILYLASPMASFITGAALVVDGGMLVPTGGMGFQEGGTGAGTKK